MAIQTLHKSVTSIAVVAVIGTSIAAIATNAIPAWPAVVVCFFLAVLGIATIAIWRMPQQVFPLIAALFGTLVVGRLLSTIRLDGTASPQTLDPLLLAETGPGIPSVTYASVVLFILLAAQLLDFMRRDIRSGAGASREQWGLTALRIYVGLMFIAHFVGHLFAGPAPFGVYVAYFGSIGLPAPAAFVILAGLIEVAVAIGLAFGLMTRIAAIGAAVYLFVAVGLGGHFGVGYVWVLPTGGWEFPALWIFAVLIFAFTGGGPISIDAMARRRPGMPAILSSVLA